MNSLGRRGQGQRCKWSTGEEEWGQIVRRKVVEGVERQNSQKLRRHGHLQPLGANMYLYVYSCNETGCFYP